MDLFRNLGILAVLALTVAGCPSDDESTDDTDGDTETVETDTETE